jgi:UTP--glucose-1-phosphate uridylyltransferase
MGGTVAIGTCGGRTTATARIRVAVLPAAGLGTRMAPGTLAVPKELMPVGGRPAIDFVLDEAFAAGIDEVLVVSSPRKPALRSYLSRGEIPELRGREHARSGVVRVIDQPEPRGLGDAVRLARDALGGQPFAVLLPDELMLGGEALLARMLELHMSCGGSVIGVMEVSQDEVSAYGCVRPVASALDGVIMAGGFVEKPMPHEAPSRLAIVGRYVLDEDVLARLSDLPAGHNGEVQLTSALDLAAHETPLCCVEVGPSDRRLDVGSWAGWLLANEILFGGPLASESSAGAAMSRQPA